MTFASVTKTDVNSIPVVDITSLRNNNDPLDVARALHDASQNFGFVYIKGHGIPEEGINAARDAAYAFFHQPDEAKERVKVSGTHRGWLGYGGAKMADNLARDLKESFIWGYEDNDGTSPEDHALRGANKWPENQTGLRHAAMTYFNQVHKVAHHLMRGFALGLDLDQNYFLQTCDKPLSRASFVYYPPQDIDTTRDQYGVGPHTDFGVLTVLCQDNVGGLQIESLEGEWIEAPPIEGTLVVNVGDLLSRWTDGVYRSTPHRVVNSSGRERLSLVLAFDPDPETIIDARSIYGSDYEAREGKTSCGDYLTWRFKKAFSYRK